MLEYYTTDSACPWKTGGPDNSSSVNLACLCSSSPQSQRGQWWTSVQTCSERCDNGEKTMKSDIYQTETFLPGMAHLHGSLDFSVSKKQTVTGTLRNVLLKKGCGGDMNQTMSPLTNTKLTAHEQSLCSSRRPPLPARAVFFLLCHLWMPNSHYFIRVNEICRLIRCILWWCLRFLSHLHHNSDFQNQ